MCPQASSEANICQGHSLDVLLFYVSGNNKAQVTWGKAYWHFVVITLRKLIRKVDEKHILLLTSDRHLVNHSSVKVLCINNTNDMAHILYIACTSIIPGYCDTSLENGAYNVPCQK